MAKQRWNLIAYMYQYSVRQLGSRIKVEAEVLLPYLALGALRHGEFSGPWENPLTGPWDAGTTLVLDIGAHVGEFAAEAWRTMAPFRHEAPLRTSSDWSGPQKKAPRKFRLVALEPHPVSFAALQERAFTLGWPDESFCALRAAASSQPAASVDFVADGGESLTSRLVDSATDIQHQKDNSGASQTISVDQVTVDKLIAEGICGLDPKSRVYLLKIDCEGHDGRVLQGAERLLSAQRVKYLLFEHLSDSASDEQLDVILQRLWNFGYGCFLILDRLLVPVSTNWFFPMYRSQVHGGILWNVDLFCADPHDRDLPALVEGYVTHSYALTARNVVLEALHDWKTLLPRRTRGVREHYHLDEVLARYTANDAGRKLFIGDLFRAGYSATPTARERREALAWFRRASVAGQATGSSVEAAANVELGHCYHFGECAPVALQRAMHYYKLVILDGKMTSPEALGLYELARLQLEENTTA